MRKILFIFLCIIPLSLFSTEPSVVAKKFVENYAKGNIAEAKKYVDEKSQIILSFMENQAEAIPKYPDYTFNLIDSIVGRNAAIIEYTTPDNKPDRLILVKEDNNWKVSLGQTKY